MQGRIFQLQAEFQTGLSFNSQYTSKGIKLQNRVEAECIQKKNKQ